MGKELIIALVIAGFGLSIWGVAPIWLRARVAAGATQRRPMRRAEVVRVSFGCIVAVATLLCCVAIIGFLSTDWGKFG